MSHFTVGIITKCNPDYDIISDILAPYDENIEVKPYIGKTKEQLIEIKKQDLNNLKEHNKEYFEKNNLQKLIKLSDEELLDVIRKEYEEYNTPLDENDNYITTYNPNSKWDWWTIGGRWSYEIPTKNNITPDNTMKLKDIDFGECMSVEDYLKIHPEIKNDYEELLSGKKETFYNLKYLKKRYPTINEFVEQDKNFTTYAVITPDRKWHEPGRMLYFGATEATIEDEIDWQKNFYNKYIKPYDNDYYFTLVDCHI